MEAYPKYKDSGVPWLGKVPENWGIRRTKYILKETDKRSNDGTEELLSVSQYTGVTPRKKKDNSDIVDSRASSLVGYKVVHNNDLVVNIMLAWNGSLGVSPYSGIVSPAYCIYRFSSEVLPKYYHYLFKTDLYKSTFKTYSTGVVDSRLRLYSDKLGRIESLIPSLDEQQQISRYLDWQTSKINKFIKAKKKLITLLKEQKQNVINEAVTKGINPDVKMKDSGVEWLGEIPEHWEVRRAKTVCDRIIDCKNRTPPDGPVDGYRVIRTSDVKNGVLINTNLTWTTKNGYEIWTQRGAPKEGDVFFTREAPCGEACLVPDNHNFCMGQRMMYFRPNRKLLNSSYLLYSIYGPCVQEYIKISNNGSTVGHLRLGQVYGLPIVWCSVDEQEQIVAHIEKETSLIDKTIARTEREIELIEEYRTRLVSDVVTGKVDVRSVEIPDFEPVEAGLEVQDAEESDLSAEQAGDELITEEEE